MASFRRKIDQEQPTFSPTSPHFLQIVPGSSSRYTKLRIPKKFVRTYGQDLSNPMHLKVPSGEEWEVEAVTCDGGVRFDKSWQKFSEYYTLDYGDLLVFRYEGNSKFHVCIFDRSATEIDYPTTPPSVEDADDESVEILEDFPPYLKSRDKSPLPCPRPHVKKRVSPSSSSETDNSSNDLQKVIFERARTLTQVEKDKALQRAIGFKSEKPHFKVALQPSYISNKLMFPENFAKRYLRKQFESVSTAILRGQEGGTWRVKLKRSEESKAVFQQGWLAFVRDNNLKVGDVCVFTLTEDIELSFEVAFFRAPETENCPLSPEEPLTASKSAYSGSESLEDNDDCIEISEGLQFSQGKVGGN